MNEVGVAYVIQSFLSYQMMHIIYYVSALTYGIVTALCTLGGYPSS